MFHQVISKLVDEDRTGGLVAGRQRPEVVDLIEDVAHLAGLDAARHRRQEIVLHRPNLRHHLAQLHKLVQRLLRRAGVLGGQVPPKQLTVHRVLNAHEVAQNEVLLDLVANHKGQLPVNAVLLHRLSVQRLQLHVGGALQIKGVLLKVEEVGGAEEEYLGKGGLEEDQLVSAAQRLEALDALGEINEVLYLELLLVEGVGEVVDEADHVDAARRRLAEDRRHLLDDLQAVGVVGRLQLVGQRLQRGGGGPGGCCCCSHVKWGVKRVRLEGRRQWRLK
ncbi:hypothetical protein TYRP_015192 [Tyrophagus putrescentiae]|nr:hypothetical protein TYRP_015192 [Tyrophagus putrescentiae]